MTGQSKWIYQAILYCTANRLRCVAGLSQILHIQGHEPGLGHLTFVTAANFVFSAYSICIKKYFHGQKIAVLWWEIHLSSLHIRLVTTWVLNSKGTSMEWTLSSIHVVMPEDWCTPACMVSSQQTKVPILSSCRAYAIRIEHGDHNSTGCECCRCEPHARVQLEWIQYLFCDCIMVADWGCHLLESWLFFEAEVADFLIQL